MVKEKLHQKKGRGLHNGNIDLRPLKKWMQRGEITEICKEVGIKETQASNIVSGRSKNFQFVQKFLERVEKNKALKQRIDDLS